MAVIQTDFPEPVAPAIKRWGIRARSATTGCPETSRPSAIASGVPIEAYFHWSFIDNFEWGYGYKHRFGLIFCDYQNGGARTLKDSARWYAEVIRSNGAALG